MVCLAYNALHYVSIVLRYSLKPKRDKEMSKLPKRVTLFFVNQLLQESKPNTIRFDSLTDITFEFKTEHFFIEFNVYTNTPINKKFKSDDVSFDLFATVLKLKTTREPTVSIHDVSGNLLKSSQIPMTILKDMIKDMPEENNQGFRIFQ